MRKGSNQKGIALIVCLLVMAVLSLLGSSAVMISSTNQNTVSNYREQARVFNVAESGIHYALARIKSDISWRGNATTGSDSAQPFLSPGHVAGACNVAISDSSDDGNGRYDPLLPPGHLMLESVATLDGTTQGVRAIVELTPAPDVLADIDKKAVITSGDNGGSIYCAVNGYDEFGNLDTGAMVATQATLPNINGKALVELADFTFDDFDDDAVDELKANGATGFWKDAPANTRPWIVHAGGVMNVTGDRIIGGILYVEGESACLSGAVKVHGIVCAPNATLTVEIHPWGNPSDRQVMGQVLCGSGGVRATGDHADVQLVPGYVDAFMNLGGALVYAELVPGTWKQY